MGTICASSYANIFKDHFERKLYIDIYIYIYIYIYISVFTRTFINLFKVDQQYILYIDRK